MPNKFTEELVDDSAADINDSPKNEPKSFGKFT